MNDNFKYVTRIHDDIRDAISKASKQPYMFHGQHPITQLATGYEAGIRALCELQRLHDAVSDLRNVLNVMMSMQDEGLDVSAALPSLGIILEKMPEWKESPVDSIISDCSMRVMNSHKYDKLVNISTASR